MVALRLKAYIYLTDDSDEKKKNTKKCVIKQKLKFKDYKSCQEAICFENEINHQQKMILK